MSYAHLEQTLNSLREVNPRSAAEHAYALAMLYKMAGDDQQATLFGRESIALFDKCSLDSIEDCAARNNIIGGIVIPDLIHQDVVRDRLQPLTL